MVDCRFSECTYYLINGAYGSEWQNVVFAKLSAFASVCLGLEESDRGLKVL